MLVCVKCWERKEDCKCNNIAYVEIDNRIYKAINNLKLAGYKTIACCEWHTKYGIIQGYILFKWDKDTQMFKDLPDNWQYDSYTYRKIKHYKYNIIRSIIPESRKIKKLTTEQKQEIIDKNITNLIRWTEKLSNK